MILFFKSISNSRKVHEQHQEHEHKLDDTFTSLTVWRKSLVISCNGFTVIDSNGNLAFRVDNYTGHPEELILMDGSGKTVLTMCRHKRLGLVDNWRVYEGEVGEQSSSKKPIFCVRKHKNILQPNMNVLARVYDDDGTSGKRCVYVIEGSYTQRFCRVLDESRRVVAEIKRKEAMVVGVSFGLEVFLLIVRPEFDPGFAMAIVLLLDQMFS
ncbi:protein LURP-one-related 17-like [Cornus florida]|uniref:protein LURP-one-related 17-like n=1 Tax=Cornus florida TaxID=4283 RepID=UPI002898BB6B|nr:protein LURP-one-related 17-like [Cornus florida]